MRFNTAKASSSEISPSKLSFSSEDRVGASTLYNRRHLQHPFLSIHTIVHKNLSSPSQFPSWSKSAAPSSFSINDKCFCTKFLFSKGKNIVKAFHPPVSILFFILQSYLQLFAVSGVLAPPPLFPRVQGRFHLWYGGLPVSLFLT